VARRDAAQRRTVRGRSRVDRRGAPPRLAVFNGAAISAEQPLEKAQIERIQVSTVANRPGFDRR
jgi:hypothetical protein